MTQEERDKITAFVASMGFENSSDVRILADTIEIAIERRREWRAKRDAQLVGEWAPGGWRREPTQ